MARPTKGVIFDRPSANKIADATRRVLGKSTDLVGPRLPYRGGGGSTMRWGSVVATWAEADGNITTLTPCAGPDGSTPTGEDDIDVYIYLPIDYEPQAVQLLVDKIVAYWPFSLSDGTRSGVLVSVPVENGPCAIIGT